MKTLTLLVLLTLSVGGTDAQPMRVVPVSIRASTILDNLFDINGLSKFDNLYGIPLEPGDIVGNAYLGSDWKRATFLLYDQKMLEGYAARYEIGQDHFEIRTDAGVKVLQGTRVKSFVWADSATRIPHFFINGRQLTDEQGTPPTGFFEVLTEGTFSLLAKTELVVKNADYNEKFDMGNRNTRILKKTVYFYAGSGIIRRVPAVRKKLLLIFGEQAHAVETFIAVNKLSLKDAGHLAAIFDHYNSLTVTN